MPYDNSENQEKTPTNPKDPEAVIKKHAKLHASGKHDEARELARDMEKQFPANTEVQLYLGEYYEDRGNLEEADKCFERALKASPDDPAARRAVAVSCIEKNELSRAGDLLSFMRFKAPHQDPNVLFSLATAHQKNGNHSEALSYFQIIARDFPSIARDDNKFRKAVRESEKYLGHADTILPKKEFLTGIKWKPLAAVLFFLVAAFFVVNWYLSSHQSLHVVNQLLTPATVTLPGQEPFVISPGQKKVVNVSEGKYEANIQVEKGLSQTAAIDISNQWYERFFSKKVFILNVGKGAVILWEQTVYSEHPRETDPYHYRFYVGDAFLTFDKIDYKFELFPQTITLEEGALAQRSRVSVFNMDPLATLSILEQENIPAQKILTYIEAHLVNLMGFHQSEEVLKIYVDLSQESNDLKRAITFLARGLDRRPLWVDWHRNYQDTCQMAGQQEKLMAQYDSMLEKDPKNSGLLYLRGRLETSLNSAFAYYDRAIAANGNNSHAYFAKAFHLAAKGELALAKKNCARALQLNPHSPRMEDMFYQLRFALGEYDELEKEVLEVLAENPIDGDYFTQLLEIRAAKKDNNGAQQALKDYLQALEKELPRDIYQFKLKSQMQLAYVLGDFKTYVKDAANLKDESFRSENLKIAYLNLGNMEKLEKLPGIKEKADGYECLLFWLAWLEKGNSQKASQWMQKAIENFQASQYEDKIVAQLLQEPGKNLLNQLDDIPMDMSGKRILYAAFARLYPSEKRNLLARAKKLNNNYKYPYHFLKKQLNQ